MPSLVVGTAGHIDHGKSALVKALTGTDPDRLKEEQERGITIDLGFAHASIGGLDVAFVDVPGHERFVRNMLAGAGGIDAVMLVVAADESVMPQTREHFEICRLLGIERGIVVLTKTDLADQDAIDLATLEVRELTADSFLASASVVPVSARTGAGLDALRAAIAALGRGPARAGRTDAARLPIDRVFSVKGFGTVVTGTLVAGRIAEGDDLVALPDDRRVRVRGIQIHGRSVATADAPRRTAVNLGAIEVQALARGTTLAPPDSLPVTRYVDARIEVLARSTVRHGSRLRVHHGTAETEARVVVCATRPAGGAWRQVAIGDAAVTIPPGADAFVRLRLRSRMVLARHDRIVLRALSPPDTIGGGVVLDPLPPPGGLRRAGALARFEALDVPRTGATTEATRLAALTWMRDAGDRGIAAGELACRGGMSHATSTTCLAAIVESGAGVAAAGRVFDATRLQAIEAQIVELVTARHKQDALDPGIPREDVRERALPAAAAGLFDFLLDRLGRAGTVVGTDRLVLASHRPAKTAAEADACDKVERAVKSAGLVPPDAAALASATRLSAAEIGRATTLLVRERRLVQIGDLLFHAEPLAAFKADVQTMRQASGASPATLDVAVVKARYGLSRKFAIPLLEWLDRERVTRRVGASRIVL
jgi:selenocysteine-specific elongation factor